MGINPQEAVKIGLICGARQVSALADLVAATGLTQGGRLDTTS